MDHLQHQSKDDNNFADHISTDSQGQQGGDQRIDGSSEFKKNEDKVQGIMVMSGEEIKIRGELESEIEKNLEEEIKDGIYHLALRLHRLYQHQKQRKAAASGTEALSEVNISIGIRMGGGTKVEFKEMVKNVEKEPHRHRRRWSSNSYPKTTVPVTKNKKFDWANSLRSGNKKNVGSASIQGKGSNIAGTGGSNTVAEQGWKW